MSERDERCCGNCRYWMQLEGYEIIEGKPQDNFGECRRYPPVLTSDESEIATFGLTEHGVWCGEHKPTDESTGDE